MPLTRRVLLLLAATMVVSAAAASVANGSAKTIAPTKTQRAGILKAFGDPAAAAPCLVVRIAAADHNYGTVRFDRSKACVKWAADGVNVFERTGRNRWQDRFEGSSYACPLPRIPTSVQRDLGVCPDGGG